MQKILRFSVWCILLIFMASCGLMTKKTNPSFSSQQVSLIQEGEINDPMRVLLITNKKDSVLLRTQSSDVLFPEDKTMLDYFSKRLVASMTNPENPGVGIAAPQVGILKNVIAVQRFDKKDKPIECYYNPVITQYSTLKQPCLEGCLSIPNKMDTTRNRAYAILLEYQNIEGKKNIELVEDFTAVIFQHEIDHLRGILFTDHVDQEIEDAEKKLKLSQH
jgi:peptide deformylase